MLAWVIILFIAGMVLILAEFLIPGLVCGVVGALFVLASGGLGCYTYPDHAWLIIVGEFAGVVVSIMLGIYILSSTRAGKHLVLQESQQAKSGWVASDSDMSLVGKEGKVFTALRPAGSIIIDKKRIDAVSDGSFIEEGATIRVIEVYGSRVVVERAGPG